MKLFKILISCITILAMASAVSADTLDEVKKRGYVKAGIHGSLFGFGMPDDKGEMKGIDVDTAKAIAAAVFGDASKVKFTSLTAVQRLPALQSKEIDVLCRNTTRTLSTGNQIRAEFRTAQLLRRPGLPHSQKTWGHQRQGTGRRNRMRSSGHHHGNECSRLFQGQRNEMVPSGHRKHRRAQQRLFRRPL